MNLKLYEMIFTLTFVVTDTILDVTKYMATSNGKSAAMFRDDPVACITKDFVTWLLIGWKLCRQPIRGQVRKMLSYTNFNRRSC